MPLIQLTLMQVIEAVLTAPDSSHIRDLITDFMADLVGKEKEVVLQLDRYLAYGLWINNTSGARAVLGNAYKSKKFEPIRMFIEIHSEKLRRHLNNGESEAKAKKLESDVEELTNQLDAATESGTSYTVVITQLTNENAELEAEIRNLEDRNGMLEAENAELKAKLEREGGELETEIRNLEAENNKLEGEKAELTAELGAKISKLEGENVQLKMELAVEVAAKRDESNDLMELRKQLRELKRQKKAVDAMPTDAESDSERKIDQLKSANILSEEAIRTLTDKVDELAKKHSNLESAYDMEREAHQAAKQQLLEAKASCEELVKQKDQLEAQTTERYEMAISASEHHRSRVQELEDEISKLAGEKQELETMLSVVREERSMWHKSCSRSRASWTKLTSSTNRR